MRARQAGFTLVELLIAITLVAAISAGLLTTMRNALLTMEKTQQRLGENRKALGVADLIRRQIGGAMPVKGICGAGEQSGPRDIFRGNSSALLLVSNESMDEGSRGHPRIALYQVRNNPDGTVRLEVTEQLFSGPSSTVPYCDLDPKKFGVPTNGPAPLVLLDKLAYCRFIYRNLNQSTLFGRDVLEEWVHPYLPYAIRVELETIPGTNARMPVGSITIPLHISKYPGETYFDDY
jgi:general secretion pathway protein J